MTESIRMISEAKAVNMATVDIDGKVIKVEGWEFPLGTPQRVKEQRLIDMAKEQVGNGT